MKFDKSKIKRLGYHPSIGKEYSLYFEYNGFVWYLSRPGGTPSNLGKKSQEELKSLVYYGKLVLFT